MKAIPLMVIFGSMLIGTQAWTQELNLPDLHNFRSEQNLKSGLVDDYPQFSTYYVVGMDFTYDKEYESQFVYNQAGQVLTETRLYEDRSSFRYTNEYNDQGLLIRKTEEKLTDDSWQMFNRSILTYDSEQNPTRVTNETYNTETGQWVLADRYDYQNDYENALLKRRTVSRYDTSTASMVPESRFTYTYNDRNLVFTEIVELYSNESWTNSTRTECHYQDNSLATSEMLIDKWQNSAWEKYMKYILTYSENNNLDMLTYVWMSYLADYLLQYRMIWRYDFRGNGILNTFELFLNDVWNLISGDQYLITYVNNHAVERIHQKYSTGSELKTGTPGWVNYEKWEYSDFLNVGVDLSPVPGLMLACFPNPATGSVEITYTTPRAGNVKLTLMTLEGKVTRYSQEPGLHGKVSWDLNKLPAGIYVIRLSDQSGKAITQKIIKD
ncbi:MAG: T9SS type A sorting domain-containing protein [Bacteroidota bacterium]